MITFAETHFFDYCFQLLLNQWLPWIQPKLLPFSSNIEGWRRCRLQTNNYSYWVTTHVC